MKTTKFAKISLLVLSVALILGAVFAMNISAETAGPEIISQNMAYSNEFKIMYAVDAASVPDGGAVTLKVYTKDPTVESSEPVATMTAEAATPAAETGNLNKDAYIFTTETGVSYAKMTLNFYAQAEANGVKGAVKRYSVAEYFFEKLADEEASDERKAFYQDTLDFGTGIQKFATTPAVPENELISNLRYVKIANGGTVGGYSAGIYLKGSTLTLDNPGTATWNVVEYDINGTTVNFASTTSEFVVADNTKTLVTTDNIVDNRMNYRDGADNFDSSETLPSYFSGNATLETAPGKGNVSKLSFASGAQIVLNKNQTDTTNATALEISFDMKLDLTNSNKSGAVLRLETTGNNWLTWIRIAPNSYDDNSLYIASQDAGYGSITIPDIDVTKWFHIRFVIYNNDKSVYVYVNGSETEAVRITGSGGDGFHQSWNGDVTGISKALFTSAGSCSITGLDIYLDNYFCGYITDEKPAN